jgi:hypothetical protein
MSNHSNDLENFASNRTQTSDTNSGEVIMNRIQKAAAAVVALTITLAGAAFVTAPMALADMQPLAMHQGVSVVVAKIDNYYKGVTGTRHG